jgi:hypothetical protein
MRYSTRLKQKRENSMRRTIMIAIAMALVAQVTWAAAPRNMSYQGVLRDADGDLVADGIYSLIFKLYDASSTELWSETHGSVQLTNGIFSVILGNTAALDLPFDKPYFLGIAVGGDPELSPRFPLTSSPYCLSPSGGNNSACRVYKINDQASTGSWTKIGLQGESYDLQDEFDTSTSRFSPQEAGIYSVDAQVEYSATGGSIKYYIAIVVNGSVYAQKIKVQDMPNTPTAVSIAQDVLLQPGDYLEIHGRQASGVSLLYLASHTITFMSIHKTASIAP